jgi:aryl-alcohol dehydrogenase-like predicted oxidoreductase
MTNFLETTLPKIATPVYRLGLSASYWPGKAAVHKALDEGLNYFFLFGIDRQMVKVLREALPRERERYVLATGAYNYIWWHQDLRRTLEKRLRQLRTDYIDIFHFLGIMKPREFTARVRDDLEALRQDGRVRAVAVSCHDRKFAARLAADGVLDAIMIRYNAAHRGAEQDIFPHLEGKPAGVVSYTATRWSYLLRRPRGWPKDGRVPTAGMCYRFVLSNPHVNLCLTAPRNQKQLEENIAAVRQGPLAEDEMGFMREFGDAVYRQYKWFM